MGDIKSFLHMQILHLYNKNNFTSWWRWCLMILSSTFFLCVFNFFSISFIFFCFSNYNIFILFSIWIVSLNPCLHSCWNLLSDSHMLKWASDMFSLSSIKLIYILLIYEIYKTPIRFIFVSILTTLSLTQHLPSLS